MIREEDVCNGLEFYLHGVKCKIARIDRDSCEVTNAEGARICFPVDEILSCGSLVSSIKEAPEQVEHPSHYAWLKSLCGVEPIDICRHFDFAVGNALKYLMRKGKVDGRKTAEEKRVEDLRKAIFYIEDEIGMLEGKDDKL